MGVKLNLENSQLWGCISNFFIFTKCTLVKLVDFNTIYKKKIEWKIEACGKRFIQIFEKKLGNNMESVTNQMAKMNLDQAKKPCRFFDGYSLVYWLSIFLIFLIAYSTNTHSLFSIFIILVCFSCSSWMNEVLKTNIPNERQS